MIDRDEDRDVLVNEHKLYKKFLKERGIPRFRYLSRKKLSDISATDLKNITVVDYIYKTGDTLSKISYKHYGDTRYWWVIGWFNNKPIDNLCKLGDVIHIPFPIEEALYYVSKNG